MKTYGVMGGVAAGVLMLVVACGEDEPKKAATPMGGSGGSGVAGQAEGGDSTEAGAPAAGSSSAGQDMGGSGGSGGSAGSAGSGGNGGSGGAMPLTFQSKPAGVVLELDAAAKASGLTLASSSVTQETETSLFYTEWLGELYNGSNQTQCLIAITGDFQNAAGTTVIKFDTYAQGAAYDLGASTLSSPCVAPGESVPVWSNDLPEQALPLDTITKLVVSIDPIASPDAVIHPSTPTLAAVAQVYSPTFEVWQLSSTATSVANIHNVSITFWGKSGDFVVGSEKDFHLEDFPTGASWSIDTAPLGIESVTLTKVIPYFSFIDGLDTLARRIYDEKTSELIAIRGQAVASWDAAWARRQQRREALQR